MQEYKQYIMDKEQKLLIQMNEELLNVVSLLPNSYQNIIISELIRYASQASGKALNFYNLFYSPSYCILTEINECTQNTIPDYVMGLAVKGQAMALVLHLLDDHIHDQALLANHAFLQFRTELWIAYKECLSKISCLCNGNQIVTNYLNNYFEAIVKIDEFIQLDQFHQNYISQMGTWLVIPHLLTLQSSFVEITTMLKIMEYFLLAWRYLDDVSDYREDAINGNKSVVYYNQNSFCRKLFNKISEARSKEDRICRVNSYCDETKTGQVLDKCFEKSVYFLTEARVLSEKLGMFQLKEQLQILIVSNSKELQNA